MHSNRKWNNNKCWCEGKNPKEHLVCETSIFEIRLYIVAKASVCRKYYYWFNEVIEETKLFQQKLFGQKILQQISATKKVTSKAKSFYILFIYLLITIAFLIAANIYCCFISSKTKKKLLPYHNTNIKLKEICIKNIS